jgi:hypothetical protein
MELLIIFEPHWLAWHGMAWQGLAFEISIWPGFFHSLPLLPKLYKWEKCPAACPMQPERESSIALSSGQDWFSVGPVCNCH